MIVKVTRKGPPNLRPWSMERDGLYKDNYKGCFHCEYATIKKAQGGVKCNLYDLKQSDGQRCDRWTFSDYKGRVA